MTNKIIKIEGISCAHCEMRIKKALEAIRGVTAEVNCKKGTAVVKSDSDINDKTLKETVESLDYKVTGIE